MLISIQNEREWANFCAVVLEEPDLPEQSGYRNNNERMAHRAEVDARVARAFKALSREEAARRLRKARTAFGFVNELSDLATHPALRRAEVETPNGVASIIAPPIIRDGASRKLGQVPEVGQHDSEIRTEFLAGPAPCPFPASQPVEPQTGRQVS